MVYSFETQAWEEQSGIELVVTDGQHVRSPGDAREEREGAGGGGGSSLVLEPCGAVAWLTLVKAGAVKKKVPQISLSLELQPVQLVITEDVVCKGAGPFTTQFTCCTSTKVQTLTQEGKQRWPMPCSSSARAGHSSKSGPRAPTEDTTESGGNTRVSEVLSLLPLQVQKYKY